jgi:hypothetical protein
LDSIGADIDGEAAGDQVWRQYPYHQMETYVAIAAPLMMG